MRVRECLPKVFFNDDLIERINRSHQPPYHGERGAINLQSGATWPNCFCNCWGLATKPFALSEKITRGSPRHAAKRCNANNVCSVDSDSINSRCTARITPQVKSNTQNFLRGKSQQYRGPAWSKPVTANGKDWVTRRSGKGLIGCWQGDESWRLQSTHSLLTRFAKRRTPKIQNWFLREEIIADTPACFIRECWNLVSNRVKWDLGRIMGCFSSQDNWENCSRPWTRKNPSSATKGLNLTRGEHLGILRPFLNASSSAEKSFPCSARIKHCLAGWSSSNDKSPFSLSAGEDFKFWLTRCTQATTRMAFVKVPHRSIGNTGGTGSHDTNAASTASSDWKEWSPGDPIWSSITQGPSTRNPGPCNHMSEFTNSSAEIPLGHQICWVVHPWTMRPSLLRSQRLDFDLIQDRAIMESVQQMYSTSSGSLRASLTNFTKRALNRQPSNSRRGNVVCFRSATLDLAITKDDTIELSQSSARKYTHAP